MSDRYSMATVIRRVDTSASTTGVVRGRVGADVGQHLGS